MVKKARIAHLAGPYATIQNTPPLVTSNKARAKGGLPLLENPDGSEARFDVLRAQRLAVPVTVYVEQFSAHPLESDASELYGPPDGYVDAAGRFHQEQQTASDKPVYEIELRPEDGFYPLPYMAIQANGTAWEEECTSPGASEANARQGFFPDGSRSFEEIDRLQIGVNGTGNLISAKADVDFYRILPPGGYTKGRPDETDRRIGVPERRGVDFFPYKPLHLSAAPGRGALARATNSIQTILASGRYDGAIWTEGSPMVEETLYWLNLLIDTTLPICGNAAQRPQGVISNDGPKNLVDSVEYITSRVWADDASNNRAGAVLIQEQQVFAAREVQKVDARPGGYVATGGHGGILGASGHQGSPLLHFLPTALHTFKSELNISRLPRDVCGVRREAGRAVSVSVPIKGDDGLLLETAIPKVAIVKDVSYWAETNALDALDTEQEIDLIAMIDHMLTKAPLAGFVVEGWVPYGSMPSKARDHLMLRAVYSGIPVVRVGRGNTEGFVPRRNPHFIAGSNLTSTKARMLLMACLIKLGSLPHAHDPDRPTPAESAAIRAKVAAYQKIFNTH